MTVCRVCGASGLQQVLDLGDVPLANSFRAPDAVGAEPTFRLGLQWCPTCAIVQIPETVDPEVLFRHYLYTPGASTTWRSHCGEIAAWLWDQLGHESDRFVVEPASNDGTLLREIMRFTPRVLGVEPALNIAEQANADGIPTDASFFGEASARRIRESHGAAHAIVGTNVLAHVPDLLDFLRGAKVLLAPDGIFVIEAPYLVDLVDSVAYDTIYHEHVSYFSVTALARIYPMVGLSLTAVQRVSVHGGSIRFVGRHAGMPVDGSVGDLLRLEAGLGYADGSALRTFADRVDQLRRAVREAISASRAAGRTIAAYGATAKGNTLLTTCNVTREDVRYIVDRNPLKQGLLAPGTGIPVVGPAEFSVHPVDDLLVLAWNLIDEIVAQEKDFHARGGRFLVPIPSPRWI